MSDSITSFQMESQLLSEMFDTAFHAHELVGGGKQWKKFF